MSFILLIVQIRQQGAYAVLDIIAARVDIVLTPFLDGILATQEMIVEAARWA